MTGVPMKMRECLASTRAAYNEMCPIKWDTRLKQPDCLGAGRRR